MNIITEKRQHERALKVLYLFYTIQYMTLQIDKNFIKKRLCTFLVLHNLFLCIQLYLFLTLTNDWFSICASIFFKKYFLSKHHPKITHYAMHICKDKHSNASYLEQPLLSCSQLPLGIFSSLEWKAQASFPDQSMSVVCRCGCYRR